MKHVKTYNQLLESIRDAMIPKNDEAVMAAFSKMNVYDRLMKINSEGLDKKFLPSDDEIREYLGSIEYVDDKIEKINKLNLDDKFRPSDNEIKEYLDDLDVEDKIANINNLKLDDKFRPSDDEIKEYLSDLDIEDWLNMVYNLDLDTSEFDPPAEKKLEYILPAEITFNSGNSSLEFSEWSDFANLFKEDRDISSEYIETILSGMGHEYFEHYETMKPDYFSFSDDKVFQVVKKELKEKIDESDFSGEDGYDEMIETLNSATSFSDLYDHVLTEYDFLDEIKDAVERAYTNAQESADESEAYNSAQKCITDMFDSGEISYNNDKQSYIMPITIPELDADDIIDNGRIIEWSVPYNGWYGDVDDNTFAEELSNQLYDV